ncbi:hypothetical protein F4703DRAFT_1826541 [Phycomyces blakesleeanus]
MLHIFAIIALLSTMYLLLINSGYNLSIVSLASSASTQWYFHINIIYYLLSNLYQMKNNVPL